MKTIRIVYLLAVLSFFAVMAGTCPAAGYQDRNDVPGHAAVQGKQGFHIPRLFDRDSGDAAIREFSASNRGPAKRRYSLLEKQADMFRVLSILETRISDSVLLDKVRHKLPELSQERLSMIASLSEHMEGSRRKPENDVAFLLIATLIIFS
jgi:hypothetical protein